MDNYTVYQDIANRTGGDIYIGVVGPVRTGKSTFIKRFMEKLVIPQADKKDRKVMTDELPQSGDGKTIMTTEPKFVPAKAANIQICKGACVSVRLVDCVGFPVEGATGFEEEGKPRLIKTPWQDEPMSFEEAGTLGTEKVIREHSTIGVLVTTDGSITDISRKAYIKAEERAVNELKNLNKPFVIVLNCVNPESQISLAKKLEEKYQNTVVAVNVEQMGEEEIKEILQKALFEFPASCIDVNIPRWLQSFAEDNEKVSALLCKLKEVAPKIKKMRDCFILENLFDEQADFINPTELKMELGQGRVEIDIQVKEQVFYEVLSSACGETITDDATLMQYVKTLAVASREYAKIKSAFEEAQENGYGIVYPLEEEYTLEKPQLVKKNAGYGVKFKANACSYHIIKVDVSGCVSPIIGTKPQGEEFVENTLRAYEEGEDKVWETNIFGKSLRALVGDELSGKSNAMPIEIRRKMKRTITKVVNEGKTNVICITF